jgi:hypothetical protein
MSRRSQAPIPAVDDELGLGARGPVRLQLGDAGLDIEPAGPNPPVRAVTRLDQGQNPGQPAMARHREGCW